MRLRPHLHLNSPWFRGLLLFVLNLVVVWPYLRLEYSTHTWGNEFGYLSIERLFRDQTWTWNPFAYCGAPFQYLYPPLFHALVAVIPLSLGHAFHLAGAFAYALIPVAIYVLGLELLRSHLGAAFAAVWYSLLASPVYLLSSAMRSSGQSVGFGPLTFLGLVQYDESPHYLAFALALFAMAFAWKERWRASCLCGAAALLTNIPGAIGLLVMLAALAAGRSPEIGWRVSLARVAALGGTTLALSSFWLTPGFLFTSHLTHRVTVASQPALGQRTFAVLAVVAFGVGLIALAFAVRVNARIRFLLIWTALAGLIAVTALVFGVDFVPLANRQGPEWNAALVLCLGWAVASFRRRQVFAAGVLFCVGAWVTRGFLSHPWGWQPPSGEAPNFITYRVASWLKDHAKNSRVFATGEIEGGLNSFASVRQLGGPFAGMSNMLMLAAQNQLQGSCLAPEAEKEITKLWLQALNVRYAVIGHPGSLETYHWLAHPQAFSDYTPAWNEGGRDVILAVPGGEEAVVVDLREFAKLPKIRSAADAAFLRRYVAWSRGLRPAKMLWLSNNTARVSTELRSDEGVLIKSSYDRGWSASSASTAPDPIGFLLIRAPAGKLESTVTFGLAWDALVGVIVSAVTLLAFCVWGPRLATAGAAVAALGAAYLVLVAHPPDNVPAAELSFRSNRIPKIFPAGLAFTAPRILTISGENFGTAASQVKVFIDGRDANVRVHALNLVAADIAGNAPPHASVRVVVDGCSSNSFLMP